MTGHVTPPGGPDDVIWVVQYLTDILEDNFEALVAKASVSTERLVRYVCWLVGLTPPYTGLRFSCSRTCFKSNLFLLLRKN